MNLKDFIKNLDFKQLCRKCFVSVILLLACYGLYNLLGFGSGGTDLKEKLALDGDDSVGSMMAFLAISIILSLAIGGTLIIFFLPRFAEVFTGFALGRSSEMYVEPTTLERARSFILQERYRESLKAYRLAIEEMQEDEFVDPDAEKESSIWLEMSQLHARNLVDRKGAIEVLHEALKYREWDEEDELSFMLRLAELYVADDFTKDEGEQMYQLILDKFPDNEYYESIASAELLKLRKNSTANLNLKVQKSPPRPSHAPTKML